MAVNGAALVDTPDEEREFDDCEDLASPVGWADITNAAGGNPDEFIAVALSNCANRDGVEVLYGPSAWDSISGGGTSSFGYRLAESISATPAVFSYTNDFQANLGHGLSTSRIVTQSEIGALRIDSLTKVQGVVMENQEYSEDLFEVDPVTGTDPKIPSLAPIVYSPRAWAWQGIPPQPVLDCPDPGNSPDDYAYAVALRDWPWMPPSGCNAPQGGAGWKVQIASFDLHEFGQANVPRYTGTDQALNCRIPMQASPTIVYAETYNICFDQGDDVPSWVRGYPWHLPPGAEFPVVADDPENQFSDWPAGTVWRICPTSLTDSFLVIGTTDTGGGSPRLHFFDINPLNLVAGDYPLKYTVNLAAGGSSNTPLVGAHSLWINDNGVLKQTDAVIVSEENGKVEMFWDLFPGPPSSVTWTVSANGAPSAPIRSSASIASGAVLIPFAETNPAAPAAPGRLDVAWVDPGNAAVQNSVPTIVSFPAYGLNTDADLITSSAVTTQATENQPRRFYIPVQDRGAQAAAPGAGLMEIDVAQILNNNPNAAGYYQYTPNPAPSVNWQTYSSPAFVSEDILGQNYIILASTILCTTCPQTTDSEVHLSTYHS